MWKIDQALDLFHRPTGYVWHKVRRKNTTASTERKPSKEEDIIWLRTTVGQDLRCVCWWYRFIAPGIISSRFSNSQLINFIEVKGSIEDSPTRKDHALKAIEHEIKALKDANEAPYSYLNIVELNTDGESRQRISGTASWETFSKKVKYSHWPWALQRKKWFRFKSGTCVARRQSSNPNGWESHWRQAQERFKTGAKNSKHDLPSFLQ